MRIFYHPALGEQDTTVNLEAEDSRHVIKVLRLREGDMVQLTNGKGGVFEAKIISANPRKCGVEIVNYRFEPKDYAHRVHIAIAPTKNMDRTEYFVEKAVELGIDRISFIQTANSERKVLKMDRIERIAVSAMKQSKKSHLPELLPLQPLKEFVAANQDDNRFIAYVPENPDHHLMNRVERDKSCCVLIGPEGGFTEEEASMSQTFGFEPASLGKSRLRTETAALAACHIVNLKNI